jgi:hypothetical protein
LFHKQELKTTGTRLLRGPDDELYIPGPQTTICGGFRDPVKEWVGMHVARPMMMREEWKIEESKGLRTTQCAELTFEEDLQKPPMITIKISEWGFISEPDDVFFPHMVRL